MAEVAKKAIAGILSLGSQVTLDDVGTGHNRLKYLMELGVHMVQGYFYARPFAPQASIAFMVEAMSEGNEALTTEGRQIIPQYLKLDMRMIPCRGSA